METWVLITIAAAFLQNVRSAMQKHLKGVMGTTGATFVRFGFGLPFAFLYLVVLWQVVGRPLPVPNGTFFLWAVIGGLAQIAATFLLVHLFSFRNFAVGTAYSRTEPAQAALFGLIFLGEKASEGTLVAIAISVVGVMLISVARTTLSARTLVTSVFSRTAGIGLLSGTFFGLSAVAYRSASLALAPSLPAPDYMMQASFTLGFVILLQTVVMLIWIVVRERDELPRIAAAWKPAFVVGFVGASASFGWFMAMTLQQAAVVKVVAQVEMLFTFASSFFIFREWINRLELLGCLLIVLGVVMLVLI
ncbi:DMT family transporter [Ensifer sp. ENS07]|jgi:drug/metabolite transporter (DMT)-like permease|uniref:DMT family transporter n=1 Tax=Ensifer adhaerens TaxID=106592 RepID=A0A9Q9D9T3_ENSAD|nr:MULTISPECIES: DMT family transporter [Ensifer]MBD9593093.1 DMT family transporter [Ensifer sp. ENS05]MBD9637966.1 DMT family transporter [Ensifer sp. ENS07]MCY1742083.1 DMT family transporter [Ensifer sp. SL37]USJ23484.1 DMT family transporter [Ensifer adhaerens]UTV36811.1 DMT family transporter [Ensifer adhaerens]